MKVHKTIRIKPKLEKQLNEIAEREGSSFTKVVEHLLEVALVEKRENLGVSLIDSAVNRIMGRHFKVLGDRLSRMIARTMLEAMTNRVLTLQLLNHHFGEDKARVYNEMAYQNAVKNIKKPVQELEEIIRNVSAPQDVSEQKEAVNP